MTQSQFPSKVAVLVLCWAAGALVPSGCEVALSDESEGGELNWNVAVMAAELLRSEQRSRASPASRCTVSFLRARILVYFVLFLPFHFFFCN